MAARPKSLALLMVRGARSATAHPAAAVRNAEVVAERPDGTRAPLIPYPTPLRDSTGKIVGAVNIVVDISERKQAETQQRTLLNELNHRVKNNMQMSQILLEAGSRRAKSSEAREVLEEASGRIMAMAAAQRVLYTTHDATRRDSTRVIFSILFAKAPGRPFLKNWKSIVKLMPCSCRMTQ